MKKTYLLPVFALISLQILAQNPETSAVKGIHQISLSVGNLERSIDFYQKIVGLEEVGRKQIKKPLKIEKASKIEHFSRKTALLQGPNGKIELIKFDGNTENSKSKMPVEGAGFTHICYQAANSNSIYGRAKGFGANILSRGNTLVDRGFEYGYAYVRDADNIMFEIEQTDTPKFTENVWVGHVAIVTHDIDRLVEFYTKLLGKKPHNRIDNIKNSPKLDDIANIDGLQLRAAWFKTGNMILEMWQFDHPKTIARSKPLPYTEIGYNKVSFEVENLTDLHQNLLKNEFTFLSEPIKTKESKEVFLRDPDGNLLSLVEFKANSAQSVDKFKKLNW